MLGRRGPGGLPILSRDGSLPSTNRMRKEKPRGAHRTTSGKYQARIKLNGKRYDLGTFMSKEDAAAAYAAAKQSGIAGVPSPVSNRAKRGTGTTPPAHDAPRTLAMCLLTSA